MKIIFSVFDNSEINPNPQMVLRRKCSTVGKSLNFGISTPETDSPAVLSQASFLTSLCFRVLMCKMRLMMVFAS